MRNELEASKDQERRVEIERLTSLKNEEIKNLKDFWQTRTNELLEHVSELKKDLNEKEMKTNEKFHEVKAQLEAENRSLHERIDKLTAEYKLKIEKIQSQQNMETKAIIEGLVKENEVRTT